MPRFSRLRALAAATLAALVIATIQPPTPGVAETPTPSDPPASAAPAIVAPPATPSPTPTLAAAPVAAPAAIESPAGAPALAALTPTPTPAAPAAGKRARSATKADRVIATAMAKRGRPWVYGASGPGAFDCSGLVLYAFGRSGALAEIGRGRYRSGSAMLRWARAHHLTRTIGHRGDVVVWGNGAHVGIYLGKGRAISTLTSGVRVHGLRVLNTRFTTFIGTGLWVPARPVRAAATSGSTPTAAATSATAAMVPTATATAATTTLAALRAKVTAHRTVTTTRLNLRAAPRLAATASRVLSHGTRLGVLRSAKDGAGRTWYRVIVGARIGWVAGWLTRPAS